MDTKARKAEAGPRGSISRREALKTIGLLGGVGLLGGCTPARIVFGWFPTEFKRNDALVERVLAGFADAVLPGVGVDGRSLARPLFDDRFPIRKYRAFLASSLCERAQAEFGDARFHRLARADRTRIIEDGLRADGTTKKLYTGAIFLLQLACYAGIYDDAEGCPAIDFEGRYQPLPAADRTYANAEDYLAEEAGSGGNYR